MYAVFRSGGKQYRAAKGDVLRLEKIEADEGATVSFDEVLLVGEGGDVTVGNPLVSGGSVSGKVLKQGKTRKVNVVKFRRRQNYLRQGTHRQFFTEGEIIDISAAGAKPTAAKSDEKSNGQAATKKTAAKKAPAKKTAVKKAASEESASGEASTKKKVSKKTAAKKTATKKDD